MKELVIFESFFGQILFIFIILQNVLSDRVIHKYSYNNLQMSYIWMIII